MLAPGGKMVFRGAPAEIEPAMGTKDWADTLYVYEEYIPTTEKAEG